MLPLLCGVLVLLAALLVEYLGHCGWLRRRDSLAGQLVLITGAAGGLGRQLALRFAQQGATLALWDVRRDALDELCEWLLERGVAPGALHPQCVDVADAAAVAREAAAQHARLGPVRVLVNNAAIVYGQPLLGGSTDGGAAAGASVPQLRRSLDVNVAAHFWTVRAFVPQMIEQGRGTVVTIGSIMSSLPAAGMAEYCASKAAVSQLHACLRWELRGARGIRSLLVRPYLIATPLFAGGAPIKVRALRALLPPLEAPYVAARIVRAVQTRQHELVLPWHLKWLPPLLEFLPLTVRDAVLDLGGAQTAMASFRGRGRADWQRMAGGGGAAAAGLD